MGGGAAGRNGICGPGRISRCPRGGADWLGGRHWRSRRRGGAARGRKETKVPARSNPRLSRDGIQASKEDEIEDCELVLIMGNELSRGRSAENVLLGVINFLGVNRLLGEGRKEGIQTPREANRHCGWNDVNHV